MRNGHAPERAIQTGIGPVEVRRPRVRDRGDGASAPVRLTSAVLPPYLRRTRNVEELLPWLDLKGVSTGQFGEALPGGPARARGARPVGGDRAPPHGGLAGGARALAEA